MLGAGSRVVLRSPTLCWECLRRAYGDSAPGCFVHASKAPEPAMGQECSTDSCAVRRGVLCQAGPVSAANLPQPGAAAAPPQKIDGYAHAQPRPSTVLLSHTFKMLQRDRVFGIVSLLPHTKAGIAMRHCRCIAKGSARHVQERPLFRFRSGSSYTGQWLGNERHGLGVQQWFDGAVYQGTWEHNCAHGQGRFVHTDGDVYCGEWQMNVAHGLGTYTHRLSGSKVTYRGEWIEDLQSGYGVESWDEGCHFEGEFKAGQKNGQGIYYWSDGSRYEGAWRRNAIHGPGYYVGADRREFHGLWQNSAIHGCGAYSWPDGRKYEGEKLGSMKASGWTANSTAKEDTTTRYEGFWLDGKQHGQGRYYHTDGYSLLALWDQGRRVEWLEDTPMPPEILPKSQMEEHSSQQ
ncbi:Phosphatidylinositol 4-phosphate 5-kinase 5 [Symbiodinium microadriaticum]|uniref:Phosphatidylinositol 4-phosphate 5-kinase 5 n=1 Tax=Symbiodinium microadriaticum TaxID=2951 RepID=A0A1Q9EMI3_SYMMI|nr:Phosphatidylinositol 4-phosphate 5-kinase 5 [Symbiodinium microadriaticum]